MNAATAEHTGSVGTGAEPTVGGWFLPFVYDPFLAWAAWAGMGERRRRRLAQVSGDVLQVGAGTGLNLPYYPRELDRLVVAEPNRRMLKRLKRRLGSLELAAEVIEAPAEVLPFDDSSFDTVVSTLVLCTVQDPMQTLREVGRVLRPRGITPLHRARAGRRRPTRTLAGSISSSVAGLRRRLQLQLLYAESSPRCRLRRLARGDRELASDAADCPAPCTRARDTGTRERDAYVNQKVRLGRRRTADDG